MNNTYRWSGPQPHPDFFFRWVERGRWKWSPEISTRTFTRDEDGSDLAHWHPSTGYQPVEGVERHRQLSYEEGVALGFVHPL